MPERSLKLRALLFLYGNGNILGCALALLGPALLFAGVIDTGWLLITAGLYVAGWLLGRRAPELERRIEDSLSVEQTLERLDRVVAQAQPHLTEDMRKSLDNVRGSVGEVLPRLVGCGLAWRRPVHRARDRAALPARNARQLRRAAAGLSHHACGEGRQDRAPVARRATGPARCKPRDRCQRRFERRSRAGGQRAVS